MDSYRNSRNTGVCARRLFVRVRDGRRLAWLAAGLSSVVVVVETAGDDSDHVRLNVVNEPVFLGDPA
jgi:hypothetical protein